MRLGLSRPKPLIRGPNRYLPLGRGLKQLGTIFSIVALLLVGATIYWFGYQRSRSPAHETVQLSGRAIVERPAPAPRETRPQPGRLIVQVLSGADHAPLRVFESRLSPLPAITWTRHETEDGRFEISAAQLEHPRRLHLRAADHLPFQAEILFAHVPPDGVLEVFQVLLEPGTEISGRVRDAATGAPILGARVRALSSVPTGRVDEYPLDLNAPVAVTTADGEFQIRHSGKEPLRHLVAWHEGYAAAFLRDLGPHQPKQDVELALSPGGSVRIHMTQAGKPAPPLLYTLDQPQSPDMAPLLAPAALGDAHGEAVLRYAPPGVYRVIIAVPEGGGEWGRSALHILPSESPAVVWEIEEFCGFFGLVTGSGSQTHLRVRLADQRYPYVTLFETRPDAKNEFEFGFVPPGNYVVRIDDPAGGIPPEEHPFAVSGGEWIHIEVPAPGGSSQDAVRAETQTETGHEQ